jgi:hypothetical protein
MRLGSFLLDPKGQFMPNNHHATVPLNLIQTTDIALVIIPCRLSVFLLF